MSWAREDELILQHTTDIVTVIDSTGIVKYQSPSVERILGYDREELIGKNALMFVHPDDRDRVREALQEALEEPEAVDSVEYRFRHRDGSWRWLESVRTERPADRSADELIVSTRDVTNRKRQEQRLDAIVSNALEAIYVKDVEGRYRFINEHGADYFDMAADEIIGKTDFDLFDAESARQIRTMDERVLAGKENRISEATQYIDGEEHVFLDNKFPYFDENGELQGLVGLSTDITDRKRQQRELEELKEEFETVFRNAQAGLALIDSDEGRAFRFQQLNPVVEAMFGVSSEAACGKTPRDVLGPEPGTTLEANYRECYERQEPLTFRETLELPGGRRTYQTKLAPVVVDGEVTHIVASKLDVTERERRAEQVEALHGATQRLLEAETEQEIADIAVDAAERLLGYPMPTVWFVNDDATALELVAQTDEHRELLEEVEAEQPTHPRGDWLWDLFEAGETKVFECLNRKRLAADIPVDSTVIVPLARFGVLSCGAAKERTFDDADVTLVTILGQSVATALRELASQRELERKNEHLEEFASVVSHDLRGPLTVAALHTELASDDCDTEHLAAIDRAHDRMESLIEDLLTLARQGQSIDETDDVDLGALARRCWQNISASTNEALLQVETEQTIRADEGRLGQLVENLYRNALEHGAEVDGGDDCDGDADDEVAVVRVGPLEGGFFIEDDGPGIPPDLRDKVFESGYSTANGGTGFGLTIVKNVAEAHGWDVSIAESPDGGARFEFTGVEMP
ncbi:PAS domain S-box protein [Haloarchaeobius sp. HME9146]|uniref:PAS domain S-box protein n=1 Tax=Haloarchaeobius sp. HME9146 TaxID=2978732 RepID=UPI0021BF31D0|nr:PAS domain S-box protein [Haloarchaeobius sp. HME9146]MCT9096640.1 PAS domain S-box protein [Haloarchaeobius sp. HME9146]